MKSAGVKVIALSGRKGAGKDFVAETISQKFLVPHVVDQIKRERVDQQQQQDEVAVMPEAESLIHRIGAVTKRLYAQANDGVSFEKLMFDREYKNSHRQVLTDFFHAASAKDELFELREIWENIQNQPGAKRTSSSSADTGERSSGGSSTQVCCLIADVRMRYELKFFREQAVKKKDILFIRIVANNDSRSQRLGCGIHETDRSKLDQTEIDLDDEVPDFVFENNEQGTSKIERELLPLLHDFTKKDIHPSASSDVLDFLEMSTGGEHANLEDYKHDVLGVPLLVSPQVLSPKFSYSGTFLVKNVMMKEASLREKVIKERSILDVGCGCGILSIFAGLPQFGGAKAVTALDISEEAVRVTKANMAEHFGSSTSSMTTAAAALQSDGFNALPEGSAFDTIVFNPPFFDRAADATKPLTQAVFDPDHAFFLRILKEAPAFLSSPSSGRMVVVVGSSGLSGAALGKGPEELIVETGLWEIVEKVEELRGHLRSVFVLALKQ